MDFELWLSSVREVLQQPDSPLALRNGHWETADRERLWDALGSRIFDSHLDLFKVCAIEVLKELDPQYDLPAEERYTASVRGKVLKHSIDLRKGMAETMALLGNRGEALTNCSLNKAKGAAVFSIREILEKADWKRWASLNNLLPTIAEAAPTEFLNSVEEALKETPCPFVELFAQEGSGVTGQNYMTGVLWALEGLSWSDEYLVRVALILAELASRDPGGNWVNRPANSLTTILLPWFPQTLAPIEKRTTSVRAIRREFPDVAWKVLLSLLPNQHQTSSGTHKPRWRGFVPATWEPKVTKEDYWNQVEVYAELAVEMARENLEKLKELVSNLDNLPKPSFDAVLEYLSSDPITGLSEPDRLPLWSTITEFARKHRRFAGANWALGSEIVSRIETVANKLAPVTPEGLYRRLFTGREFDLYDKNSDWEEQHRMLEYQRQKAIQEIMDSSGMQGVITFVNTVESPNQVGLALGVVANEDIDSDLLPKYLNVENAKYEQFASGYVWSRLLHQGWDWVDGLDRARWSSEEVCGLLLHLPFKADTWRRVSEWLGDSESWYWQNVMVNPYQSDADPLPAVDKLLKVSRPDAALSCLYYRLHKGLPLDEKRTIDSLRAAASSKEAVGAMDPYQATELIKKLQLSSKTDRNVLSEIEWIYLPLLERSSDAEPRVLEQRLATDPEFFCEVIRLIFRSKLDGKEKEGITKQKERSAMNAWQLLHEWKRPPGLREDGTFSADSFRTWLRDVKEKSTQSGHNDVAITKVGEILFHCPRDPDGLWIVRPAANALNARDAEKMRMGFSTAVINSRGAHWVDPSGEPERKLANEWREKADAVENAEFARFAATLREIAKFYDSEAERIVREHKSEGG